MKIQLSRYLIGSALGFMMSATGVAQSSGTLPAGAMYSSNQDNNTGTLTIDMTKGLLSSNPPKVSSDFLNNIQGWLLSAPYNSEPVTAVVLNLGNTPQNFTLTPTFTPQNSSSISTSPLSYTLNSVMLGVVAGSSMPTITIQTNTPLSNDMQTALAKDVGSSILTISGPGPAPSFAVNFSIPSTTNPNTTTTYSTLSYNYKQSSSNSSQTQPFPYSLTPNTSSQASNVYPSSSQTLSPSRILNLTTTQQVTTPASQALPNSISTNGSQTPAPIPSIAPKTIPGN